jgi:DNA-binding Lrp family transcriptional regulator
MAKTNPESDVIDQTDKRIITLLHKNSRTPLSKIAQKVSLSKDAVAYRINKMMESGVIVKFYLDVNYAALGFSKYLLFIRLNRPSEEETLRFTEHVKGSQSIIFCASCCGEWDFWLEILADSTKSLDITLDKLFSALGSNLYDYKILAVSELAKSYEPIIEKEYTVPSKDIAAAEHAEIDKSDYLILKALENDSRMPITSIAKETGLTLDIVKYRMQKLKERGIILCFDVVIDYNKLGYELNVLLFRMKKFTREMREKLSTFLISSEKVRSFAKIAGLHDFFIELLNFGKDDYADFLSQLRTSYSDIIMNYEEIRVVKDIKDFTMPFMKFD